TPEYTDDVLHAKMRSMVTAAVMRAKLDKSEPSISYERFVEQLDSGDSFTATIMEVLVKEVADRSSRPNQHDRRLIASNTAKSLTKLANPYRVYRPHSGINRRSTQLSSFINTVNPEDFDEVVDMDEFESTVESVAAQEGARFSSSALHDSLPWARRWHSPEDEELATAPGPTEDAVDPPRTRLNWRAPARSSLTSSLSRHPSIHRAPRPRTLDFNDFTTRRRNSLRETLGATREGSAEPGNAEGSGSTS
ncbi:hypothetical protein HDZ31DRAFT_10413, partial [Schizophyllum fasciatum]